jgi:hypothetical protein
MHKASRWINRTRGAGYEKNRGTVKLRVNSVQAEWDLTKPDNVRTYRRSADYTGGKGLIRVIDGAVCEGLSAPDTSRLKETSMHMMDATRPSSLVQVIYVLRT